ncbi:hypothetical protein GCM10017562_01100 [Streptomyces roseofulvus]|uniref:hypothetical protein n=1 Tax=Streptomyces roseofulvus TaxID=33902 RepID=UPI0031F88EB0
MTVPARRSLGSGPAKPIRAAEADLVRELPGIGFPDLDALRGRGVLGPHPAEASKPSRRRALGTKPPQPEWEERSAAVEE